MRNPVDRLSGRPSDAPPDHVHASRAALIQRLRDLPPNHASAVCDVPRSGLARADDERTPGRDRGHSGDEPAELSGTEAPEPPLWRHVGQFKATWSDHVRRWPGERGTEQAGVDRHRPDQPPGSWRGQADQYLSPEANAEAEEVIASLQRCEPAVTELLQAIEQTGNYGGVLVGMEHRLKGGDRLREKIADKMAVKPGSALADVAHGIADAVRYTFCFGNDNYVRGYSDVHRRLVASGYELMYRRNHWLTDHQYKGVNCRWKAPDGHVFELQFHTGESFFAKEDLTHPAYRRARRPTISRAELVALTAFQWDVCDAVTAPAGISGIADHNVRH